MEKEYDLESLHLPRLSGIPLRFLTHILEGVLSPLVATKLLNDFGLRNYRRKDFSEEATFYPIFPFEGEALAQESFPPFLEMLLGKKERVSSDFYFPTIREYADGYRSGSFTPEEVAERVIAAIAEMEENSPSLKAFISSDSGDIRNKAKKSTERYRAGKPLSLLDGVPIAIKDEIDQVSYKTTKGTLFIGESPLDIDATVTAKLRAAGALLIGKTNMDEIGLDVTGTSSRWGIPRNPYNLSHMTGGSSSGSAVAVAAGICPAAVGTDGGGSIRVPSSLCGLFGLKPTFGRVSTWGSHPFEKSVGHLGPIAGSTEDALLLYAAIAGSDSRDPASIRQPSLALEGWDNCDLSDMTLGIYDPWFEDAESETVESCRSLVIEFEKRGAKVKKVCIPHLELARVAHMVTIGSEIAYSMEGYLKKQRKELSFSSRINIAGSSKFTSLDYLKAQSIRTHFINLFSGLFSGVDAIITPTTATVAPAIPKSAFSYGQSDINLLTKLSRFIFIGNFIGAPSISFVAGYSKSGLPIGCQALGRWWDEKSLFRLSYTSEKVVALKKPAWYSSPYPKKGGGL